MAHKQLSRIVGRLRNLVSVAPGDDLTDGQLLARFVRGQDHTAFEVLLRRHGPLVRGVCRRILGDSHEAEDVFQAAFLILVRKAKSIGRADALGGWLYRVAYHAALRAQARARRRRARETRVEDVACAAVEPPCSDLRAVIDEELDRLPEKFRAPMVLCYLEGKTQEEAAAELHWPGGTVRSRLARARDMLRGRLHRRGLALTGVGLAALVEGNAEAALPAALLANTTTAASQLLGEVGGVAAEITTLVNGGIRQMFVTKCKWAAGFLLAAGLLSLGVGLAVGPSRAAPAAAEPAAGKDAAPPAAANAKPTGDVFGYSAAFEEQVAKIGQISPQDFARRYPGKAQYLAKLSWDPTTGKHWDGFTKDPATIKGGGHGRYDFRPNAEELKKFQENGFVVSERMGGASFAEIYYRVWSRDLPVYVSSDSVLHAWHRTYDAMLEELEETYLIASLDEILSGMAGGLPGAKKDYGAGLLGDSLGDADYFLAVGRSLLAGKQVASQFDQDKRVADTLAKAERMEMEEFPLFGRDRKVDFSQFKVRGHYENSEALKRYFKAMMWCGRTDMRVAGGEDKFGPLSSARELGSAIVLHNLLRRAGRMEQWQQFDQLIQTFVGKTDSATFHHLDGILVAAGIQSPADIKEAKDLEKLQSDILTAKIGMQQIRGDMYYAPLGTKKTELPRSFTVLGQKFVVDSWVTAKTVFGDIIWDGKKVERAVPSGLDVAFAALGNDATVPTLVERMTGGAHAYRDRKNYQHNLAAVREVIDSHEKSAWDENIYMNWLGTLRELSAPTTDAKYPEVMRTQAWWKKTLNTQLASWTQLRHDTILYAKQSYTEMTKCEYPAGYVEPVPHFWGRLEKLATRAADQLEKTPYPDRPIKVAEGQRPGLKPAGLKDLQKQQVKFLRNFAAQAGVLKGIAVKELEQKELTAEETKFLQDTMQIQGGGSGQPPRYNGWYPSLFYKGRDDSGKWDALVADVHTWPASDLGPGCVLTEGVGNVDLLLVAIDNGKDRMVYAGPVLSYYEFEMPNATRKSDSEWRQELRGGKQPPRPEWTREYLAPGVNPAAQSYRHDNDDKK